MPTITILGLLQANYTWLALEAVAWQRDRRRQGNANVLYQLHSHWPLNYAQVFSKNIFFKDEEKCVTILVSILVGFYCQFDELSHLGRRKQLRK